MGWLRWLLVTMIDRHLKKHPEHRDGEGGGYEKHFLGHQHQCSPYGVHLGLTDQSENSKQEMQRVQGGPQRDQEAPTRLLRPVIPAAVEAVLSLDRMVYMTFTAHAPSIARCNHLKSLWSLRPYVPRCGAPARILLTRG